METNVDPLTLIEWDVVVIENVSKDSVIVATFYDDFHGLHQEICVFTGQDVDLLCSRDTDMKPWLFVEHMVRNMTKRMLDSIYHYKEE